MKNNVNKKIKWILAFALIFALAISVFALFNPNCVFGHKYVNGICSDCGNVCEHKEIKNGKCVVCKKEIKDITDEEIKETDSGVTDLATGEILYSNHSYSVRNRQ